MRLALPVTRRSRLIWIAALAWAALVATLVVPQLTETAAAACPPGFQPAGSGEQQLSPAEKAQLPPQYRTGSDLDLKELEEVGCVAIDRPETFSELATRDRQLSAMRTAPLSSTPAGMNLAAAEQRRELDDASVPGDEGTFAPYGQGPLNFDEEPFDAGQGIIDSTGRIDDFHYDAETGHLFAAVGTGGIWLSDDVGDTWRPISNSLPTQVVGAVSYSPRGGPQGTVTVITGEHTFGGSAFTGIGAYWSADLGATWNRAEGVPDGALGFAIEVDPSNPQVVYAATGNGLYRSTDVGRSYTDVVLPTGECAGKYDNETCNFANFVTDVVIQTPGGSTDAPGGAVTAVVGWRAGMMENPDGSVQSPNNGVYLSEDGTPGSFERAPGLDEAVGGKERLGRIELGPAIGEEQDHGYLYATVEDAVLFNGGVRTSGLPDNEVLGANPTVLSGVYVSADFGATWTQMGNRETISDNCAANMSVYCIPGVIEPGAQAWYNQWIAPDPSAQLGGIPTTLVFGLEEVWKNTSDPSPIPLVGPTDFTVFGKYYGSQDCLLVATDCAVNRIADIQTPHPDQHAGIFIETEDEVTLLIGHDGGVSRQVKDVDGFDQNSWDLEQENGLDTLLPYSAVIANDGVAYAGLQDNGHMRIDPTRDLRKFEVFGADGTFAAVDPENSDVAIESTQNAGMNLTYDGGMNWTAIPPPDARAGTVRFVNPFTMDPTDRNHIISGGRQIQELTELPEEGGRAEWTTVFDLGTVEAPEGGPTTDAVEKPSNGQTALDVIGADAYAGFCGVCDILNSPFEFRSGIATNVNGDEEPAKGSMAGWHFATAEGLPNRYVTSVAMDPSDPTHETIYVTLGGVSRRWVPPGTAGNTVEDFGEGHVYKSIDAGESFVDISGNLPDITALWVEPRGGQLLVAMDNGVYVSSDSAGSAWASLGGDQLPTSPVYSIQLKADDPNLAVFAVYGRGVWTFEFDEDPIAPNARLLPQTEGPEEPEVPATPAPAPSEVPGSTEVPLPDAEIRRVAGPSRIDTAVATSEEHFQTADAVVLSRGDLYADALAGAPFARSEDAPVLLTPSNELAPQVAAEIERLGAGTVYVLGGETAINTSVVTALEDDGLAVERIGGENRFGTAAQIAEQLGGTTAYVAEGADADPSRGWPDALSVAPLAAKQGVPILLVTTESLPQETADALDALGTTNATVVGGTSAVSAEVESAIGAQDVATRRVAGANRFETSAKLATFAEGAGLSAANLWLTRGSDWPDALTSGPTVAATDGLLLLVGDNSLEESPSTAAIIEDRVCEIEIARLLGGTEALAQSLEDEVRELVLGRSCTTTQPGEPQPTSSPSPSPSASPTASPAPAPSEPTTGGSEEPPPVGEPVAGPFGFEEDAEGWTVATTGNPTDAWARATGEGEGHDGSMTSFQVVPYGDLDDTSLVSPEIEVGGGTVTLEWWETLDVEGGGFDELAVEYKPVAESEWIELASLGGQNVGYPDFGKVQVEFAPPAGPIQVRFRLFSDEICSSTAPPGLCTPYEGVRIDDVTLFERAA